MKCPSCGRDMIHYPHIYSSDKCESVECRTVISREGSRRTYLWMSGGRKIEIPDGHLLVGPKQESGSIGGMVL